MTALTLADLTPHIPGRIESIPIDLYPEYMAREGLTPNGVSPLGTCMSDGKRLPLLRSTSR